MGADCSRSLAVDHIRGEDSMRTRRAYPCIRFTGVDFSRSRDMLPTYTIYGGRVFSFSGNLPPPIRFIVFIAGPFPLCQNAHCSALIELTPAVSPNSQTNALSNFPIGQFALLNWCLKLNLSAD